MIYYPFLFIYIILTIIRAIKLGVWHDDAEKEIVKSGIPYTFLRPNNLMSNYMLFSQDTIKYTGVIYGSFGNGKISLVHPSDVGAISSAILLNPENHKNKAYEITGYKFYITFCLEYLFTQNKIDQKL